MCSGGFAVAGGIMSLLANFYGGIANKKFLDKQAEATEKQADETEAQGRSASRQQQIRTAKIVGAQRAAYAGSGVDVNVGSALETQVETGKAGEMDAQMIREDYRNKAWSLRTQAAILYEQGNVARRIGLLGGAANLMDSFGSVAGRYYPKEAPARTEGAYDPYRPTGKYTYQKTAGYRKEPKWGT